MSHISLTDEQTKALQKKSLDMLLFFDDFCKQHGLTYFLCGGCCIGAIRNGGFIPWDDDIDVFMPRPDYEKLKQIFVNTDGYSIQFTKKDYITENQFLTICANNTTFIKTYQKELDINHGIMLDVLPLDACPNGFKRKMQKLYALLYSLFIVGKAPENHGKAIYIGAKVLLTLIPKSLHYSFWHYCEKQMTKYSFEKCDYVTELCAGPYYLKNEYPKEAFKESLLVDFEGHKIPIPIGYDIYLKMAFGDYTELPPETDRECHHEYEFIDTENSYKKYRGIYYFVK